MQAKAKSQVLRPKGYGRMLDRPQRELVDTVLWLGVAAPAASASGGGKHDLTFRFIGGGRKLADA
jgi:hypothetical protein